MLIPSDSDFDTAAEKLLEAGFRPAPWSYGALVPEFLPELRTKLDPMRMSGYEIVDDNCVRFKFPENIHSGPERVVLLRSAYTKLSPPGDSKSMGRFLNQDNLYYPDKALLMESFIKTLLQSSSGTWYQSLRCWTISYMYGMSIVNDTVLDSCDDERIRLWFNETIRRGKGGLDMTVTKRKGKSKRA